MKTMISIEGLVYDYPARSPEEQPVRALDGLDLTVREGSFVAVLGVNGSGKSTLAKCLNGLYVAVDGRVLIDGMDAADDDNIWKIRSAVGMVFQNPDNQMVSSIVEDDVAFGPENLGVPTEEIRRRIDAAMKAAGIYEQRQKKVHLLSGGQKQRAAIAGVLAMEPRCVVFDESTAMLDPRGREGVMEIIGNLRREGITTILITHNMEEAVKADRVVIMREGRIVEEGTPAVVFADRKQIAAAGLDLPPAVAIREDLKEKGIPVPDYVLDMDSLAAWLMEASAAAAAGDPEE